MRGYTKPRLNLELLDANTNRKLEKKKPKYTDSKWWRIPQTHYLLNQECIDPTRTDCLLNQEHIDPTHTDCLLNQEHWPNSHWLFAKPRVHKNGRLVTHSYALLAK